MVSKSEFYSQKEIITFTNILEINYCVINSINSYFLDKKKISIIISKNYNMAEENFFRSGYKTDLI